MIIFVITMDACAVFLRRELTGYSRIDVSVIN